MTETFDSLWSELLDGIQTILIKSDCNDFSALSLKDFTKLNGKATQILITKSMLTPQKLSERIEAVLRAYVKNKMNKIFNQVTSLLTEISYFWRNYKSIIMKMLLKIFSYHEVVSKRIRSKESLKSVLLGIIQVDVFEQLKPQLLDEFLKMTLLARTDVVDFDVLKNFLDLLGSMNLGERGGNGVSGVSGETFYDSEIEKVLIQQSQELYKSRFMLLLNNRYELLDFLEEGLEVINKEVKVCEKFLPVQTVSLLKSELVKMIFYDNGKKVIETKLETELENRNLKSLSLLYDVFKEDKKNSIQNINFIYKHHVRKEFMKLIAQYEDSKAIDSEDLAYHSNYLEDFHIFYIYHLTLIQECFQNENLIRVSLNDVLDNIQLNNCKYNNSYILSFYLDKIMNKESLEFEVEIKIRKVVELFNSIPDKDIFLEGHRKLLVSRLVSNSFLSIELEKDLIQSFKVIGGDNYTSNLESIISDYIASSGFSQSFNQTINCSWLSIQLYDYDKWPKAFDASTSIPAMMKHIYSPLKDFYSSLNPNRHLRFDLSNTSAEIIHRHSSILFCCNGVQALILLAFNICEGSLNLKTLQNELGIEKQDLSWNLSILVKKSVIVISNDGEKAMLNIDSINRSNNRIEILNEKIKYIIKDQKIDIDRSYAIEAAIVRVMKKTPKIMHGDLLSKLKSENMLFIIDNTTVKIKLENLIERGLIERSKVNTEEYLYNY